RASGSARIGRVALLIGALLGPWLSFPSVFILGGVSAALLLEAWRRHQGAAWLHWLGFNALLLLSCLALWWGTARDHNTPGLQAWWTAYFLDLSSPLSAVRGMAGSVVEVGHYGTTGLGVPLAILAALGLPVVWSRSRALAALLTVPLLLAWLASALH